MISREELASCLKIQSLMDRMVGTRALPGGHFPAYVHDDELLHVMAQGEATPENLRRILFWFALYRDALREMALVQVTSLPQEFVNAHWFSAKAWRALKWADAEAIGVPTQELIATINGGLRRPSGCAP